jgi:hypothetical protein
MELDSVRLGIAGMIDGSVHFFGSRSLLVFGDHGMKIRRAPW